MKYEATITFEAYEDDYNNGELYGIDNEWTETLEANTPEELKEKICDATYNNWYYIDRDEDADEDEEAAYRTSYLANADNEGQATIADIEQWKKGETRLWAINCYIAVSKVTKEKVTL